MNIRRAQLNQAKGQLVFCISECPTCYFRELWKQHDTHILCHYLVFLLFMFACQIRPGMTVLTLTFLLIKRGRQKFNMRRALTWAYQRPNYCADERLQQKVAQGEKKAFKITSFRLTLLCSSSQWPEFLRHTFSITQSTEERKILLLLLWIHWSVITD